MSISRAERHGITLGDLAARLGGELIGDPAIVVRRVATLESAGEGDLAFLSNPRYAAQLANCQAAAVILKPAQREASDRPRILTADPYLYFARAAQLLNPPAVATPGIHPRATVMSELPASVSVAAGAVIEEEVELGEGVIVGANCFIGRGSRIGAHSRLYPNVTIYADCVVGRNAILHAGVVIGADGFGFAREADGSWVKIPQTGRVVIGDDVEIGANTTIDRGALDDTVIESGVKLDNLIQIAHNVRIGEKTIMAGCAGVAGSAQIGKRCMIGGQAGISGHLKIADDVVVSAWTLVAKSINKPGVYTSNLPLQSHADWVRNFSHLRHLDTHFSTFADRIRALEQRLDDPESPS